MFDQAAAAGVVVAFGGGRAAESVAELGEETLAETVQPGVGDGGAEALDFREIAVLFFAGGGIAGIEVVQRPRIGLMERELLGIQAVLVLNPFSLKPDDGGFGKGVGLLIDGRVRPDLEGEMPGGVGEGEFQIGLVGLGLAGGAGLELGVDGGNDGGFSREFLEGGDGDGS